jgi:hypothetical protein
VINLKEITTLEEVKGDHNENMLAAEDKRSH